MNVIKMAELVKGNTEAVDEDTSIVRFANGEYLVMRNGFVGRIYDCGVSVSHSGYESYHKTTAKISLDDSSSPYISQVVAMTFMLDDFYKVLYRISNKSVPVVNHKNGNIQDNSVENMEWITSSENMMHGVIMNRIGRITGYSWQVGYKYFDKFNRDNECHLNSDRLTKKTLELFDKLEDQLIEDKIPCIEYIPIKEYRAVS